MFNNLSREELERIACSTRKIDVGKGDILFHKDDPCHGFYLIVAGKIKLLVVSASGNEKVVEILSTGHTFGEAVMFMDKPYPVSAQALQRSHLIHVAKSAMFEALDSNPLFARKLITGLSIRLHQHVRNQELNSLLSGKQRIADYLLGLIPPAEINTPEPSLTLPTSKNTIASHLGITPEHFSRILHEMIDSGLLAVNRKNIRILDISRTRRLLDTNT